MLQERLSLLLIPSPKMKVKTAQPVSEITLRYYTLYCQLSQMLNAVCATLRPDLRGEAEIEVTAVEANTKRAVIRWQREFQASIKQQGGDPEQRWEDFLDENSTLFSILLEVVKQEEYSERLLMLDLLRAYASLATPQERHAFVSQALGPYANTPKPQQPSL